MLIGSSFVLKPSTGGKSAILPSSSSSSCSSMMESAVSVRQSQSSPSPCGCHPRNIPESSPCCRELFGEDCFTESIKIYIKEWNKTICSSTPASEKLDVKVAECAKNMHRLMTTWIFQRGTKFSLKRITVHLAVTIFNCSNRNLFSILKGMFSEGGVVSSDLMEAATQIARLRAGASLIIAAKMCDHRVPVASDFEDSEITNSKISLYEMKVMKELDWKIPTNISLLHAFHHVLHMFCHQTQSGASFFNQRFYGTRSTAYFREDMDREEKQDERLIWKTFYRYCVALVDLYAIFWFHNQELDRLHPVVISMGILHTVFEFEPMFFHPILLLVGEARLSQLTSFCMEASGIELPKWQESMCLTKQRLESVKSREIVTKHLNDPHYSAQNSHYEGIQTFFCGDYLDLLSKA